ncbi:MAG: TetR/AcrR family transcriptional regulator [Gemmataceae bacterium]
MAKRGRPADEAGKAKRREEILAHAGRAFASRGYPGTDMQAVADAAGVAKGTLYLYFPDGKEQLFLAAVDQGVLRMKDHVHAAADRVADPIARIEAAIVAYMNYFKDHPEQVELWVIERGVFRDRHAPAYFRHREAGIEVWRNLLRDQINAGRLRDLPVQRIDDVLSDLLYGAMMANHFSGRHRPPLEQARDVIDIAFNGILSDSERRRRARKETPR